VRCVCDYVSTWCADGWEVDKNIVYVVSIILFVRYECRFVFVAGRINCQPAHEPDAAAGWQGESAAWQGLVESGGVVLAGVYLRGLRRPACEPTARVLLGQCESYRAAGCTMRRSGMLRLLRWRITAIMGWIRGLCASSIPMGCACVRMTEGVRGRWGISKN